MGRVIYSHAISLTYSWSFAPVPTLLTEGDVVQIEVSRRLVFKPSEGKVTLKGGRCPQSPVCGGGEGMELWTYQVLSGGKQ